jgi:hypothetical protein
MEKLAVFVNTSDGFDDCWLAFFRLFAKYGGDLNSSTVYLNTEKKDYAYEGITLVPTKVWLHGEPRPTWSECLARGLEKIAEPYVLYLQEDYFLSQDVDTGCIAHAHQILESEPDVGVIYLNRYGPQFRNEIPRPDGFVEIRPPASYLLSTQAAIWRKDVLASLVCEWENGWMFEKFGSWRARKLTYRFLSVNRDVMQSKPVFEYVYTGVIKGQWKADCVELFAREGIEVDFTKRGFYQERGRLKSRIEVLRKLFGNPVNAFRSIRTLV